MKRNLKKAVSLLLVALMVLSLVACGSGVQTIKKDENKGTGKYAGQTVILHTNDVHGAVEGYSYLPALKAEIEKEGGSVILADAGDFTNGNIYVSISEGESAVTLMNQAGYDVVALGNHEFDFGFDTLKKNLEKANFKVLCSNVYKDGKTIYDSEAVIKVGGLKVGFFALHTPETQTKVNPSTIEGLTFTEKEDLYKVAQEEADKLKKAADVVICLAHLGVDEESAGNRSTDVMANTTGIDMIIDGHSHTVMTKGEKGEAIQSTGTEFANIGCVVIDNKTKKIVSNELIETAKLAQDADVLATAKNIISTVDTEFGAKFATSAVALDGVKANVRSGETNLGDLVCDALLWSATNETKLEVEKDMVVAVTNGGGIRASVDAGDVSRSTIKTVLPFGNTIAVNYITGAELLEALEASTYSTPEAIGGFPQIAGMKISIDTTVAFDEGDEYPDSTYHAPKTCGRVMILEVNGKPFDPTATYAVVTNNFCAAGGDTYYAFKRAYDAGKGFDTSIPMDEALVNFIKFNLGGEIGAAYAEPQGRIRVIVAQG